jgi:hypothetical protein
MSATGAIAPATDGAWASIPWFRGFDDGREKLPMGGHESAHWWPRFLPGGGHEVAQLFGWLLIRHAWS